ncbi:hypothetical protein [Flammeovirga kamogawensis]|uniref:Tetratricopeptide repeat protein n=1 Tax=Flammeovirga kamogawensis TaxID=373891 RepID=A0ABX8GTU7_9BACT|nr:hypothetical protein [Flammeovirga kamogawensis]MBB6459927.1 tetratricopeptide (TPR) repeat protein [Flammeovirga kamogawensis]QWG07020.1 hypothetical protein KM029_17220 [Flammeovirga kamogawensis]TRX68841.1 hypothetical protein EO216_12205 [Flammeovirga kamogawensis]
MKYRVIKQLFLSFTLILLFLTSSLVSASIYHGKQDKVTSKKNTSEKEEWLHYANSAKQCIEASNLMDALELIDISIEINKNSTNLEIKGDYYTSMGNLTKAFEHYQLAIQHFNNNGNNNIMLKTLHNKANLTKNTLSLKK